MANGRGRASRAQALAGSKMGRRPQAAPESAREVDVIAGRYRIKSLLGEGGMKRVWLAADAALEREVALAVIRADHADPETLERVRREALAMARLGDHPNVVGVHDIGEHEGQPFITSQYLPGGSVRDQLAEHGALGLRTALHIARDIASALDHAHANGVIHRDVKPGNVWLTRDGIAKLGDFGLAVALDRSRMTVEATMLGTVSYMSPEQAQGRTATPQSDLYSLGAVLYELLTGRPPFTADTPAALLYQTVHTTPDPPSLLRRGLPGELDELVLSLLAKDPDDRPGRAGDVAVVLDQLAASVSDDPPPAPRRRRPRTDVYGGSIVALARSVRQRPPDLTRHAASDGTVTLMFIDIESSTPLAEQLGDRDWLEVLHGFDKLVTSQVEGRDGSIVDKAGDGFLVVFGSAREAMRSAIAIQRTLHKRRLHGQPIRARIGLHTGEALKDAERFVGRHVHLAARVGSHAIGGEVLVSSVTRELVAGESFAFGSAREVELKGFSGTHRVVPLLWRDEDTPTPVPVKRAPAQPPPPPVEPTPQPAGGRGPRRLPSVPLAGVAIGVVVALALGVVGYGVVSRNNPPPATPAPSDPVAALLGSLAYQRSSANYEVHIYIVNADDPDDQRRLTPDGSQQRWPSWGTSGQRVSFTEGDGQNARIAVASIDGSGHRVLAEGGADCDWSRHGPGPMVFVSGPSMQEIHVMDADGSNRRRITAPPLGGNSPAWSPDGTQIVFTSSRDGNDEVYVMNADGSDQRRITRNPAIDGNPSWSPDGKRIAFTSNRAGDLEIYSMKPDGSDVRRLTRSPGPDSNAVWSNDSKSIAFTSERDGNAEIYVMNADGSSPRRITNNPGRDEYPNFRPSQPR